MKTTIDHSPPHGIELVRPSTLRLGLLVSVVAAAAAVVVQSLTHLATVVILIPVVVVGFALSWHAAGRATGAGRP